MDLVPASAVQSDQHHNCSSDGCGLRRFTKSGNPKRCSDLLPVFHRLSRLLNGHRQWGIDRVRGQGMLVHSGFKTHASNVLHVVDGIGSRRSHGGKLVHCSEAVGVNEQRDSENILLAKPGLSGFCRTKLCALNLDLDTRDHKSADVTLSVTNGNAQS